MSRQSRCFGFCFVLDEAAASAAWLVFWCARVACACVLCVVVQWYTTACPCVCTIDLLKLALIHSILCGFKPSHPLSKSQVCI